MCEVLGAQSHKWQNNVLNGSRKNARFEGSRTTDDVPAKVCLYENEQNLRILRLIYVCIVRL